MSRRDAPLQYVEYHWTLQIDCAGRPSKTLELVTASRDDAVVTAQWLVVDYPPQRTFSIYPGGHKLIDVHAHQALIDAATTIRRKLGDKAAVKQI